MKQNLELELAWDFVNNTNRNIFLTGKAGTGKTTFLQSLKMQSQKRMVVVAPTGVAAINAKGVTIHSFFQMPFGPILPDTDLNSSSNFNRKFSKSKINIIKSLDLLVIDEISMVRADLLDGIDKVLRRYNNRDLVFGGVQVLMIGDLQQLSPVVKEHEWQLLSPFYKNMYFFSSLAYQNSNPITIELKYIYRQENPIFIDILNEIRNNNLSQSSAEELNKRHQPNFAPEDNEGYISLTTHNHKADQLNKEKLESLKGEYRLYHAIIQGKFPEHSFPNEEELELKVGAQVMFIKNDSSPEKRYYNGKIGKVLLLDDNEVIVHCPDDDFNIVVKPEIWENIKYTVNPDTKEITEDRIGSYEQIPLRLAWSVTIHKSQGLTFERAIIDAEDAFAHGQTYVALSRCKTLEGLVLKSKITPHQIISDNNVITFNKEAESNQPNEDILLKSRRKFQLDLIAEIFYFYKFLQPINRILDVYYKNRGSVQGEIEELFNSLKTNIVNLLKISTSFKNQLQSIGNSIDIPEKHTLIQERFTKAITYFIEQTKSTIEQPLSTLSYTTDNKAIEKDINKQLDTLDELLTVKLYYFEGLKKGFNTHEFLKLRANAVFLIEKKPKKIRKLIIDTTENVELYELLKSLRNEIAEQEGIVHYQVFTQKSLYAMCEILPTSAQELKSIHGMGKKRIEKYGAQILQVIRDYCEDNNIEPSQRRTVFEEQSPKSKQVKGTTKKISLDLFKKGKTIGQIAIERELSENTIFGHLAHFVPSGEVKITDLMPQSHFLELKESIPTVTFENLSDLKHQLDDKYSYAELRLVLNQISEN